MAPITSFLSSNIFKVIGPGKTTFRIHGDLLARKSNVLAKDVNGTMREKETKMIEIEAVDDDIDDDTVMRFLEYVYTGDYPVPDPVILQLPSDSKEVNEAFCSNEPIQSEENTKYVYPSDMPPGAFEPAFRKGAKGSSKRNNRWHKSSMLKLEECPAPLLQSDEGSGQLHETHEAPVAELHESDPFRSINAIKTRDILWKAFCSSARLPKPREWRPPANNDQREDFTAVFLCHARLYKFSDRYECPKLMGLSLQRLRLTLSQYQFHQERASAIVELIRYTYQHTMEFEEGHDKLRLLVLKYATCYIHQLSKEESFLELMKEPGSLASDLLVKLVGLFP